MEATEKISACRSTSQEAMLVIRDQFIYLYNDHRMNMETNYEEHIIKYPQILHFI